MPLFISLLFALTIPINIPSVPILPSIPPVPSVPQVETQVQGMQVFATYRNSGFTEVETNFSPGQTLFVKAEMGTGKELSAKLTLLDSEKAEIKNIDLNRVGSYFWAQFSAPSSVGTYYLHFNAKGDGMSFDMERNINVLTSASPIAFPSDTPIPTPTQPVVSVGIINSNPIIVNNYVQQGLNQLKIIFVKLFENFLKNLTTGY